MFERMFGGGERVFFSINNCIDSWDIIVLDTEAADNAESEASEMVQMRLTIQRYDEERKLMMDEIGQLKEMLKREVTQAELETAKNTAIVNEYKLIRQRLETQLHTVKNELESIKVNNRLLGGKWDYSFL